MLGRGSIIVPRMKNFDRQNFQVRVPSGRYEDEKGHSVIVLRTIAGGLDTCGGSGRVAVVPVWRGAWQPRVLSALTVGAD